MWLMQLGEVVFGGAGSGLYGMLMFAIVAVFIAGLMVGRTPEYLGKKIEAYEMKMASLVLLIPCVVVLVGTALASVLPAATSQRRESGRARLLGDPVRVLLGRQQQRQRVRRSVRQHPVLQLSRWVSAMWISRFWLMIPVLAIAGSLARQAPRRRPPARCPRTRRCSSLMLVGVVLMVGALTFVPALALGPMVEHLQMSEAHGVPAESFVSGPLPRRGRCATRSASSIRGCSCATR